MVTLSLTTTVTFAPACPAVPVVVTPSDVPNVELPFLNTSG